MEKSNRGILLAAPVAMAALLLGLVAPGTALMSTQATTDSVGPHGYVVVTVTRDGNEVYRHEDHNLITNAGKDFISAQIGSTTPAGNGANFIALTTTAVTPAAGDTALAGEITSGGLSRGTAGTYAHTNGQSTFTVTKQFSATATHTNVQSAGLFTAAVTGTPGAGGDDGTMMAENTFSSVTLQNGDQLTITWTITLS
ncbi:MAG: hypothetical protein ACREAY_01810 [Nitrososphaera sp.]|uniref:hypothetical protein n=1 Tax=Nitrososphaera sp. TaxID=1971748 RepID=UPI003D6F12F5